MTVCPVECLSVGKPDWLETHESFVLTTVASVGGAFGILLTYFLKSRCTEIKCCGVRCRRTPIEIPASHISVENNVV